jgi:hypothetical protein
MFPSVICRNKVQAQVEATQAGQHKPFEVGRDAADILASFGTLEDTVRNVRRPRGDWRFVIHHAWEDRGAANGRARRFQRIHHSIVVTSCPDIGTG